jgi:hypothetical protein
MKIIIMAFITAFLLNNVCIARTASLEPLHPWKTWKKSKSLSVSSRVSTIDNLTEIKVTAIVNSSLAGFLLFIQDVNNTPAWLANASSSKVIKQMSVSENIFTVEFTAIWPLEPRYLQLHSTYWQNSDLSVEIQLKDDFTLNIDHSNAVRVKFHQGHWLLTPIANTQQQKQLLVEYSFIADSGGEMPTWFADQLALKSILKSMRKLSLQLPQSKWQQQSIPNITELN